MSEFATVVIAALVAQLLVLPGEKVQFIIAGLSTRYRPLVVVSAAGLAFAGWTALEIWFGQALKGALPQLYLDVFTGGLFVLFGVLLLRSMPEGASLEPAAETDGGLAAVEGVSVPLGERMSDGLRTFLAIFAMMATGEFGDKTQLVTIGLAVQYGAHPGIWVGEMLAIVPVSLANAYFFHTFADRFDARKAHAGAAAIFFFFGLDTFLAVLTGFSVWETVVETISGVLQVVVSLVVAL
ncbi:MAG: TMEM165/GDT1 family protein [Haloarculaceae archaeon]